MNRKEEEEDGEKKSRNESSLICSLRKSLLPGRKILLEENIINYVHKEKENQG